MADTHEVWRQFQKHEIPVFCEQNGKEKVVGSLMYPREWVEDWDFLLVTATELALVRQLKDWRDAAESEVCLPYLAVNEIHRGASRCA